MNKNAITEGMRVLNTDCRKRYREGTVVALTRISEGSSSSGQPDYALIRYDSFWKRDEWTHTMDLYPIEGELPTTSKPD